MPSKQKELSYFAICKDKDGKEHRILVRPADRRMGFYLVNPETGHEHLAHTSRGRKGVEDEIRTVYGYTDCRFEY